LSTCDLPYTPVGTAEMGSVVEVLELFSEEGDTYGRVGGPVPGWILMSSGDTHNALPRHHHDSKDITSRVTADSTVEKDAKASQASLVEHILQNPITSQRSNPQPYACSLVGTQNSKEGLGDCLLCLYPLSSDPRVTMNLCSEEPPCSCLVHRSCYFDRQTPMNDHLRVCMICHAPVNPTIVRQRINGECPLQTQQGS